MFFFFVFALTLLFVGGLFTLFLFFYVLDLIADRPKAQPVDLFWLTAFTILLCAFVAGFSYLIYNFTHHVG